VLYHLEDEDDSEDISTRKEFLPSRMLMAEEAVQSLVKQFVRFKVFNVHIQSAEDSEDTTSVINLTSLATKDVASEEIENDLLTAFERGKDALIKQPSVITQKQRVLCTNYHVQV
jgi:hypothetical protein